MTRDDLPEWIQNSWIPTDWIPFLMIVGAVASIAVLIAAFQTMLEWLEDRRKKAKEEEWEWEPINEWIEEIKDYGKPDPEDE